MNDSTYYKTTFKLRRGHTEALREQNVLPSQGEPIFDIDLNKLKIGDGVKHYNELEYIGKSVITANSVEEFPVQGDSECLYIAADPESIYRFDAISKTYIPLYADALSNKVDKVEGKELSSNDFTDDYKSKLEGIQTGAEVNVQSDWKQNDTTANNYIKNRPGGYIDNNNAIVKIPEKYLDIKNTNIVNGSETGSLRTVGSSEESSEYTIGTYAFAEGNNTKAHGVASHAEGEGTKAPGEYSHAEGISTTASSAASHAEGNNTKASGINSHAEGRMTIAASISQHVQGRYNIGDANNTYADIIGNGNDDTHRSNAYTLDWKGNAWYSGDVYVGSTSGINKDEGSKKLATEEYIDTQIGDINTALDSIIAIQNSLIGGN